MTAGIVGALRVVLGMDSSAFEKGAGAAEKRIARLEKSMRRAGRQMQRAGTRMAAAISLPLVGIATKAVAAQKEQERAIAAVTAALNSMGDGAGYTLSQLEDMASALQSKSLYGDEEILNKVTANLLTFGNISGDVFARAQQMALDLSARLGQDLQSSAIMLGKALNDPIQGLSALSRAGVQFDDEQKDLIRTMAEAGDIAGAQAIMMAELEKQYSGQAEALAKTDSGRITQAWNAIGDALEKAGAIILPIMAEFADKVKELAEKFQNLAPETQKIIVVAGALAAALAPLAIVAGLVVSALAPLAGIILAIISPMGLMAAAAVTAAVAIYQSWDQLSARFPVMSKMISVPLGNLRESFRIFTEGVTGGLALVGTAAQQAVSGDFMGALETMDAGLRLMGSQAVESLLALFGTSSQKLIELAKNLWDGYRNIAANAEAGVVNIASRAVQAVKNLGADMLQAAKDMAVYLFEAAVGIGAALIDGIKQGIMEKWDAFSGWLTGKMEGLVGGVKALLKIQSPSRVFRDIGRFIMQGLQLGVGDGAGGVMQELADITEGMTALLASVGKGLAGYAASAMDVAVGLGKSLTSAFQSAENAVAEFVKTGKFDFRSLVTSMIADLARLAARRFLLGPAAGAISGFFDSLAGLYGPVFHDGGVVGASAPQRLVPALAFAGAPRMHSGGWAGLRPDEVPAILQRGERVLSRREVASGAGQAAPVNITIVTRDAESFRQSRAQVAADLSRAVALGRRGM